MAGPPVAPKGIPKIRFDYFNLGEIPDYILCNPNKQELYSLGGISERTLSAKFNTLSEISFRADEYIDEQKMPYYDYLVNRKVVKVISNDEITSYFLINDVEEINDGISKYKKVTAQSLEAEMISKKLVGYMSGSGIWSGSTVYNEPAPVTLKHLLDDLIYGVDTGGTSGGPSGSVTYIPEWRYGIIPQSNPELVPSGIGTRYRTFDISDKTIYDFLMTDVEKEYGCVFHFDTEEKTIYIYNPEEAVTDTDIFISHDNLIKELNIKEVTDELATCLTVAGGNGLNIIDINPLGNSRIYRFSYFKNTDWMEQDLIDSISAWENKIISSSAVYAETTYNMNIHIDEREMYQNIVEITSGSLDYLNTELQVAIDNNYPPEQIQEIQDQIQEMTMVLTRNTAYRNMANQAFQADFDAAHEIAHGLSLTNILNFTSDQYIRLQPFIIQSSFVDDNITITDNMSASTTYEHMGMLYSSASATLLKMSEPKFTFDIDSVNFMQIKEFQTFRDQIVLGARVRIEIRQGEFLDAILLEMDFNFDDPTDFKLVFGNRLKNDNDSLKFSDLMGKALDAGNTVRLYGQQLQNWNRIYQQQVINTINPIVTVDGLSTNPPSNDITANGYKEGVYINTGNFVNIVTPSLLWNGYPIGGAGGGAVREGPGIDINGITVGLGGDTILLYYGNIPVDEFGTIREALAAAASGNMVYLPPGIFTEDISIPNGVSLVSMGNNSIISGSVTMVGQCWMKGINVDITRNTAQTVAGLISGTSGTCILNDCAVRIRNNGVGNVFGVQMRAGNLTLWNSVIESTSNAGGNAIGVYEDINLNGALNSSDTYYVAQTSGGGRGYAFTNKGQADWYITAGKTIATTAPVGEI